MGALPERSVPKVRRHSSRTAPPSRRSPAGASQKPGASPLPHRVPRNSPRAPGETNAPRAQARSRLRFRTVSSAGGRSSQLPPSREPCS